MTFIFAAALRGPGTAEDLAKHHIHISYRMHGFLPVGAPSTSGETTCEARTSN